MHNYVTSECFNTLIILPLRKKFNPCKWVYFCHTYLYSLFLLESETKYVFLIPSLFYSSQSLISVSCEHLPELPPACRFLSQALSFGGTRAKISEQRTKAGRLRTEVSGNSGTLGAHLTLPHCVWGAALFFFCYARCIV